MARFLRFVLAFFDIEILAEGDFAVEFLKLIAPAFALLHLSSFGMKGLADRAVVDLL